MKKTDYELLLKQAEALVGDCPHRIANLSNLSALIYASMEDLNWAGFYLLEGETLVLGPFQGRPACIEIPFGKGVCGTAAALDRAQVVEDVELFPGHIACDSASQSEIVIPLHKDGRVAGVLDLDSPSRSRFTKEDREGLERLASLIESSGTCL